MGVGCFVKADCQRMQLTEPVTQIKAITMTKIAH